MILLTSDKHESKCPNSLLTIAAKGSECQHLKPNGPAIKGVSVAERVKAGAVKPNRGRVLVPAVMSEAWRGFWCHGTMFRAYTSVAVQG